MLKLLAVSLFFSFSLLSFAVPVPVSASTSSNDATKTVIDNLNKAVNDKSPYKTQKSENPRDFLTKRVTNIIAFILSFLGVVFLVLTIYAGFLWMTARGNEAQVSKAKDMLTNAVIGLIIITAAYSITAFVGNQLIR